MAHLVNLTKRIFHSIHSKAFPKATEVEAPEAAAQPKEIKPRPQGEPIGPRFAQIILRIMHLEREEIPDSSSLDEKKRALSKSRKRLGVIDLELKRLEQVSGMDLAEVEAALRDEGAELRASIIEMEQERTVLLRRQTEIQKRATSSWKELSRLTQTYVNACLDENFEPQWSLDTKICHELVVQATHDEQIQAIRDELIQLRLRRMRLECGHKRKECRLQKSPPASSLPSATDAKIASETLEPINTEITLCQQYLELRREQQYRAKSGLWYQFKLLVERYEPRDDRSDQSDRNTDGRADERSWSDTRYNQTFDNSQSPSDDESRQDIPLTSLSNEELRKELVEARDLLENDQLYLAECLRKTDHARRVDFFLTFTNATEAKFIRLLDSCFQDERHNVRESQERYWNLRAEMLGRGMELPNEDRLRPAKDPEGGGNRVRPAVEDERPDLGLNWELLLMRHTPWKRINDWRADYAVRPTPPDSITAATPPADVDLDGLRQSTLSPGQGLGAQWSVESSPGRKRKLDEYNEQREKVRSAAEVKRKRMGSK